MAESKLHLRITTNTPYLSHIMGEVWGVFCDDFGQNWPRYNGTALYDIPGTGVACIPEENEIMWMITFSSL